VLALFVGLVTYRDGLAFFFGVFINFYMSTADNLQKDDNSHLFIVEINETVVSLEYQVEVFSFLVVFLLPIYV